jgi:hypothetical protein
MGSLNFLQKTVPERALYMRVGPSRVSAHPLKGEWRTLMAGMKAGLNGALNDIFVAFDEHFQPVAERDR